jgi:hypothetical protein
MMEKAGDCYSSIQAVPLPEFEGVSLSKSQLPNLPSTVKNPRIGDEPRTARRKSENLLNFLTSELRR